MFCLTIVIIKTKKSPEIQYLWAFLCFKSRQRPTFPQPHGCSIIGPGGLNFRVRNGNGWDPSGKVTEKLFVGIKSYFIKEKYFFPLKKHFSPHRNFGPCLSRTNVVKSHGRLVLV